MTLTNQSKHHRTADVGQQDDSKTAHNSQGYRAFRVVRFFASGRDDIEADECVEASGGSTEHLKGTGLSENVVMVSKTYLISDLEILIIRKKQINNMKKEQLQKFTE